MVKPQSKPSPSLPPPKTYNKSFLSFPFLSTSLLLFLFPPGFPLNTSNTFYLLSPSYLYLPPQ
ncbi:hypothetical protein FKM95_000086 [Candidatus Tremblaya phenacola]|nr:hypothetical protein FKM95_000086 [Candidatus Tremblaya phenacola]